MTELLSKKQAMHAFMYGARIPVLHIEIQGKHIIERYYPYKWDSVRERQQILEYELGLVCYITVFGEKELNSNVTA